MYFPKVFARSAFLFSSVSTVAIITGSLELMTTKAEANCVVNVSIVTCSGLGTGFQNNTFDNGTINILSGAQEDGAGGNDTIFVRNGNTINIQSGAQVVDLVGNSREAIDAGTGTTINNDGLVDARRNGIEVNAGSTINNNGTVIANNRIVNASGQSNVTINNFGQMTNRANQKGLWLENNSRVFNGSASNTAAYISGGDDAILFRDDGEVINYGTISGGTVNGAATNSGDADGVDIYSGSITNYGTIQTLASGNEAIEVSSTLLGQVLQVDNYGTISAEVGIREYQSSATTTTRGVQNIVNHDGGIIESTQGAGGLALGLGDDNDSYEIHGGSTTTGMADGGNNANFGAANETDRLILGGTSAGSFDAAELSGNGGTTKYRQWEVFDKTGTSIWTLSGNNNGAFTGATNVSGGTLVNNADLGMSAFNINAGTLAGSGASGQTTIGVNGVHNAGTVGGIGAYNVNGDYIMNGTLDVDLDDAGNSDVIRVVGNVSLAGDLAINELPGAWNGNNMYTLIDNDQNDGVIGAFASVSNMLAFLDPTVDYAGGDGNDVVLTLTRNNTAFTSVATTPNQIATAGGVSTLDGSNLDSNIIVNAITGLTAAQAADAYDQLSGEIHASVGGALLERNGRVLDSIGDRIANAWVITGRHQALLNNERLAATVRDNKSTPEEEAAAYSDLLNQNTLSFWAQGSGEWRMVASDGNGAEQQTEAFDMLVATDVTSNNNLSMGMVSGYSWMQLDLDDRNSTAKVKTARSAAYLTHLRQNWQSSLVGSYAFHQIETNRNIVFPGFNRSAQAEYQAHDLSIASRVGYTARLSQMFLHPFVGLNYTWQHRDDFAETGAGAANLVAEAEDSHSLKSTVGVKIVGEYRTRGATVATEIEAAWHHEFGDVVGASTQSFEEGSDMFTVRAAKPSRDKVELNLGIQARFDNGFGAYFNSSATVSGEERTHGTKAGMKMQF
ncbi:MAG: autotransporter domain-containing protein [Hyphomicrobiales bacterium]